MKKYFKNIFLILLIPVYFLLVNIIMTARQADLLIRTILLGVVTAGICVILSSLLAIHWVHLKLKLNIIVLIGLIFLLPASIHIMVWYNVLFKIDNFVKTTMIFVLYYMPLVTFVLWLGLRHIDISYLQLSRLYKKKGELKILTGLMKPYLISTFALIAILVMNDFSVPSLCQLPTFSMEIHAFFSAHMEGSLILALPLIFLNIILLFVLFKSVRKIDLKSQFKDVRIRVSEPLKIISYIPMMFFICHLLMSIIYLFSNFSIDLYIDVLQDNASGLFYSIIISSITAVIASGIVFLIYPFKYKYLVFIFLVIPSPLVSVCIIRLLNGLNIYHFLLNSSILIVITHILHILPILLLLVSGLMMTIDQRLIQLAQLYGDKKLRLRNVYLPIMMPFIITTVLLGFAFSFNETASTLLVLPPGKDWVSLRIYSYLHYGTTERIFVLGSIVITIYLMMAMGYYGYLIKKVNFDFRNK